MTHHPLTVALFTVALLAALAVLVAGGPLGWATAPLIVPFGGWMGYTVIRRK